jgi:hypothetical protein
MADGVAADQDCISCGVPNFRIELAHNFGTGFAAVVEVPSWKG